MLCSCTTFSAAVLYCAIFLRCTDTPRTQRTMHCLRSTVQVVRVTQLFLHTTLIFSFWQWEIYFSLLHISIKCVIVTSHITVDEPQQHRLCRLRRYVAATYVCTYVSRSAREKPRRICRILRANNAGGCFVDTLVGN